MFPGDVDSSFNLLGVTSMSKLSNTVINRSVALAAATLALAAPFAAQASDADAAMDSCISAFLASHLPKDQRVQVRKEDAASSPVNVHARAYKILVTARGVQSGKYLARGSCIVDRHGQVVAVDGKPILQRLAAR
jgi:hypothetical protein